MPMAETSATAFATSATCLSFGDRHAAPMQKRVAPASWALRAAATISPVGMSRAGSSPTFHAEDWGQ